MFVAHDTHYRIFRCHQRQRHAALPNSDDLSQSPLSDPTQDLRYRPTSYSYLAVGLNTQAAPPETTLLHYAHSQHSDVAGA